MKRLFKAGATTAIVIGCGVTGLLGGAAVAIAAPQLLSPVGVSPAPDSTGVPKPAPTYPTNAAGQTYGSAADSNSPENEPDLILVVASNGHEGHASKTALSAAEGTGFTSIADAIAWSEGEGQKDHIVPVYTSDGKTQVGEFIVYGSVGHVDNTTNK